MPISPADAARILTSSGMGGFDPVRLASLRSQRKGELDDRIRADIATGDVRDTAASQFEARDLNDEINTDPYTGQHAQADVENVDDALNRAALEESPEMGDLARTRATRAADATMRTKQAGYQADTSTTGTAALDAASRRKVAESEAASGSKLLGQMLLAQQRTDAANGKGITPNAQAQSSLSSISDLESLGPRLLQKMKEKYPGIDTDPAKYGGIGDALESKAKRFAYGIGMYQPDEDIGQLQQLLRVIGSRPYMNGRPNQRVYDDIVSHLGEFGFSPGADYKRVANLLGMIPDLKQGVYDAAQPIPRQGPRQPQGGGQPGGLPPGVTITRHPQ